MKVSQAPSQALQGIPHSTFRGVRADTEKVSDLTECFVVKLAEDKNFSLLLGQFREGDLELFQEHAKSQAFLGAWLFRWCAVLD